MSVGGSLLTLTTQNAPFLRDTDDISISPDRTKVVYTRERTNQNTFKLDAQNQVVEQRRVLMSLGMIYDLIWLAASK